MFAQMASIVGGLYGAVGPGLILAAALPFSLALLVLVVRETLRRMSAEGSEHPTP